MSAHFTTFEGSVTEAIRAAISAAVADAAVEVSGSGGHYVIAVASPAFEGLNTLERHRMVYASIAHLMKGESAPVHAVDSLSTTVP